jgi:hypothetical protein
MNNTFIILLVLITQLGFCQSEAQAKLQGKVSVGADFISAVNITNQSTGASTVSNEVGVFYIPVKEGDIVVFTAINLVTLRKTISDQDISSGFLIIKMTYNSIPLEEVVIKELPQITAESLGIVPAGQKKYSAAERKLYTATSGGGIDGLLNTISGRKAMLKKEIVVEGKEQALNRLVYIFEDTYYIETLKIPSDYIGGFQYYCVDNAEFVAAVKSKNKSLIKFLIGMLADKYKKIITDEN